MELRTRTSGPPPGRPLFQWWGDAEGDSTGVDRDGGTSDEGGWVGVVGLSDISWRGGATGGL